MRSGCRIARVRDKKTGRTLEILATQPREEIARQLIEGAVKIADLSGPDLAGFFVVGIGRDGSYGAGWRALSDAPIGPTLLTAFIAEIARREIATSAEVERFCLHQGWLSE